MPPCSGWLGQPHPPPKPRTARGTPLPEFLRDHSRYLPRIQSPFPQLETRTLPQSITLASQCACATRPNRRASGCRCLAWQPRPITAGRLEIFLKPITAKGFVPISKLTQPRIGPPFFENLTWAVCPIRLELLLLLIEKKNPNYFHLHHSCRFRSSIDR